MDSSRRDLFRAFGTAAMVVIVMALVLTLRAPGVVLSVAVVAGSLAYMRRFVADPETDSLRASLAIARDDLNDVVAQYDTLLHGMSPEAVAERTLHFPALADPGALHPVIQDFQIHASAARRFISRLDARLADRNLDRAQLERLIAIADERALRLSESWRAARRVAKELGPGYDR